MTTTHRCIEPGCIVPTCRGLGGAPGDHLGELHVNTTCKPLTLEDLQDCIRTFKEQAHPSEVDYAPSWVRMGLFGFSKPVRLLKGADGVYRPERKER